MPQVHKPLFARTVFQHVAGETLRPGGLSLTTRALDLSGLPHTALVLDIGCGRGATARLLTARGHRVLALDSSEVFLSQACACGVVPLRGRAEALPLADRSVDAVFCECVLSVTGLAGAVLAEAARVLRPGGLLVLSDLYLREPAGAVRGKGMDDAPRDCVSGALPLATLQALLCRAGFAVQTFEDHSRLLAELAGRLIFAGMPPAELCPCAGPQAGKPGYFLCLARTTIN